MNVTFPCKVLTCLAQLFIVLFAGMLYVILMDKDRPAHECSDYWNVLLNWKTTGINFFNPTWANPVNNCASKISYYCNCQSKKVCIEMDVKLFIMHPLCGSKKYPYHPASWCSVRKAQLYFPCNLAFHLRVPKNFFSTISSWLEGKRNLLICCRIQQKIHETHKICLWLDPYEEFA